jgi:hypothetical protein
MLKSAEKDDRLKETKAAAMWKSVKEGAKAKAKAAKDEKVTEEPNEGNEFSGELKKAKDSGAKEFKVDGKTFPVKESISESADTTRIRQLMQRLNG